MPQVKIILVAGRRGVPLLHTLHERRSKKFREIAGWLNGSWRDYKQQAWVIANSSRPWWPRHSSAPARPCPTARHAPWLSFPHLFLETCSTSYSCRSANTRLGRTQRRRLCLDAGALQALRHHVQYDTNQLMCLISETREFKNDFYNEVFEKV